MRVLSGRFRIASRHHLRYTGRMRWLIPSIVAWSLAIIALLLLQLAPEKHFGSPQAANELAELRNTDLPALAEQMGEDFAAGFADVIEHFERTHDLHYTYRARTDNELPDSYSDINILHVASFFRKPDLVRSLLEAGADPNTPAAYGVTPLMLATCTDFSNAAEAPASAIIATADALLDAGARTAITDRPEGELLTLVAVYCTEEDVLLHLMDRGLPPNADTACAAAQRGWLQALQQMPRELLATPGIMQASLGAMLRGTSTTLACMKLLLEAGADANEGVLFVLAREIAQEPSDDPATDERLPVLEYLLRHGADPYLRAEQDDEYPGFCPYDFLATQPQLLSELAARGLQLSAPPLRFSSGEALLSELWRAASAEAPSSAAITAQADTIASVLAPLPDLMQHELYPQAVASAVLLLGRADPARAAKDIAASPLWRADHPAALAAMLEAVEDVPEISLPKELLLAHAEQWARAGLADAAAMAAELLGRCPDAAAELQALEQSDSPPLQAGALLAKLAAAGLPDARNAGVADWLLAHHREANTPFLKDALLLTSHERFWQGEPLPAEQLSHLLNLMRHIGAPQAAAAYETLSSHSNDAELIHSILSDSDTWSYELEAATARYFLQHSSEFTTPAP